MKNMGWLAIVMVSLAIGFSIGWSQSEKVDILGEKKIHAIKKSRLSIKKSEAVPRKIEILEFHSEILNGISNEVDIKYIEDRYLKGEDYYILKENLKVEEKSKIYDIFTAVDLDIIDPVDGC